MTEIEGTPEARVRAFLAGTHPNEEWWTDNPPYINMTVEDLTEVLDQLGEAIDLLVEIDETLDSIDFAHDDARVAHLRELLGNRRVPK